LLDVRNKIIIFMLSVMAKDCCVEMKTLNEVHSF
jgi:hypothetical protein